MGLIVNGVGLLGLIVNGVGLLGLIVNGVGLLGLIVNRAELLVLHAAGPCSVGTAVAAATAFPSEWIGPRLRRSTVAPRRSGNVAPMVYVVDAVLFDIDGTLVDSTPAVERTWRTWARRHGLDAEEILRVCHGRRTEDTVAMFVPQPDVVAAAAELEHLELHDLDGVVALPGAADLLDGLPAERWAAVTSGSRELMCSRLSAAGLPVPEVLVAAADVMVGKPDPEGYRRAAEELGVDPAGCLVVEDAPAGIAAGRAAGATVVAVCTSHARAELYDADAIAETLLDITVASSASGLDVAVSK